MWMATRTGQVEDTQTLQLHTRADRPLALLRQGLRIHCIVVRLVWLGRYFDTEIRLPSAGPLAHAR